MDREQIRQKYVEITSQIENSFAGYDVPADVQHFYLLCKLIALGSFERFIRCYGRFPIDADFAAVGKSDLLQMGHLSDFERDVCAIWERHLQDLERQDQSRPGTFLPGR